MSDIIFASAVSSRPKMDDIDRQLFIEIQRGIPLVRRPFEAIGKKYGLDNADVLLRISGLKKQGLLYHLGAAFDISELGYQTAVVAMAIPETDVDSAAAAVDHPGINRCAKVKAGFNFWFSLALPADELFESHVARLREIARPRQALLLKAKRFFKPGRSVSKIKTPQKFTELDKDLIRALQEDFPLTDEPFARMAKNLHLSEDWVLNQTGQFLRQGIVTKIAGTVFHKEKADTRMIVLWQVPEEKQEEIAGFLAGEAHVKSCIERFSYPELPYTLHTVVDFDSEASCQTWLAGVENQIGHWPHEVMVKEKDYKKAKLNYFPRGIESWRMGAEQNFSVLV